MLLGGRTAYLSVLGLITAYAAFTIWYTLTAQLHNPCVYATVSIDSNDGIAAKWEVYNSTIVYAYPENGAKRFSDGLSGFDYVCRENWVNESKLDVLKNMKELHDKVRIVVGTRNCRAYLWSVQLQMITGAWLIYIAFLCLRQERRLLGPFRNQNEFLSPTGYTFNYATYTLATTVLKTHYTKFALLLCEASLRRVALSRTFKRDPIGFLCEHSAALALIGLEVGTHFVARLLVVGTVTLVHTPCSQIYPIYLKLASWGFVVAVTIVEIVAIIYEKPPKTGSSANPPTPATHGVKGLCTSCCSTVLANLCGKLVYLLLVIGAVSILLHYEQRIQIGLLGESFSS
ncbi:membrane protein [Equid alphaherpesvirus 1]|uniref:Envelope glycoprotein K n=1 Tax=Equid alphaherpesvirus 1 TaxID=10326 RepID=A0A076JTV9_9ALPH|nr:membrane protein [Equid alphaherpesvirus 1]AII81737.1 membrane protein [Equid alphaherpesvirus 1]